MERAYEELVDFIAGGTTPGKIIAFRPSEASKNRALGLIERKKNGSLSLDESSELEHYLQLEHLMRLAKARAQHLNAIRMRFKEEKSKKNLHWYRADRVL